MAYNMCRNIKFFSLSENSKELQALLHYKKMVASSLNGSDTYLYHKIQVGKDIIESPKPYVTQQAIDFTNPTMHKIWKNPSQSYVNSSQSIEKFQNPSYPEANHPVWEVVFERFHQILHGFIIN